MRALMRLLCCAVLAVGLATAAKAQSNTDTYFYTPGGGGVNGAVGMCLNTSNKAVPCNAANVQPQPVTVVGGSGSTSTANQGTAGTNAQAWWVQIGNGTVGPATVSTQGQDGLAGTNLLGVYSQGMLFNGSTLSIQRDVAGWLANGFGTAATAAVPTSSANGAITPVVSAAAESAHVLKASAGNLYSVYAANQTANAGVLMILNAVSAPADGAVTPLECAALPANGNATISYNPGPASRFSTGIVAILSSGANCFSKNTTTNVITGFIRGSVQ